MKESMELGQKNTEREDIFADLMEEELDRVFGDIEKRTLREILNDYAIQRNLENEASARLAIQIVLGDSAQGLRNAIRKNNPKISEKDLNDLFTEVDRKAGFIDASSIIDPKDLEDEDRDGEQAA